MAVRRPRRRARKKAAWQDAEAAFNFGSAGSAVSVHAVLYGKVLAAAEQGWMAVVVLILLRRRVQQRSTLAAQP